MTDAPTADGELARRRDRTHVFHSSSARSARDPRVIASGLGSEVWDLDGNTYLDFAQLVNVNIEHRHPGVVHAPAHRGKVFSAYRSYHASTGTAVVGTGGAHVPPGQQPGVSGYVPVGGGTDDEVARALVIYDEALTVVEANL
ncbi:MAG TPA: hypothetical protein VIK12_00055 [Pengzhenrongella sp.]